MDAFLCAYIFAVKGNDPEFILHKTMREKMFYLAAIKFFQPKEVSNGNI